MRLKALVFLDVALGSATPMTSDALLATHLAGRRSNPSAACFALIACRRFALIASRPSAALIASRPSAALIACRSFAALSSVGGGTPTWVAPLFRRSRFCRFGRRSAEEAAEAKKGKKGQFAPQRKERAAQGFEPPAVGVDVMSN